MGSYVEHEADLDATGMRVAIVAGRFNEHITRPLLAGARKVLEQHGADPAPVYWVPGAFEIPLLAKKLAEQRRLRRGGLPRRGDPGRHARTSSTSRASAPAASCRSGWRRACRSCSACSPPTTSTRPSPGRAAPVGNKGEESALTAIEMVAHLRAIAKG